jgi:hypothetical protein
LIRDHHAPDGVLASTDASQPKSYRHSSDEGSG